MAMEPDLLKFLTDFFWGFIFSLLIASLLYIILSNRSEEAPERAESSNTFEAIEFEIEDQKSAPIPFDSRTSQKESEIVVGWAYVTDGDTIIIKNTQIRLFGIDAPELNHPYGVNAKRALLSLCKGHEIHAEITAIDHYGRTVAKCYLPNGQDLSAEMVKLGLAIDWPKYSGGIYRKLETRNVRKKLWLADARQKGRMHGWERFERQRKTVH